MTETPREQFAQILANLVSSAVKTAVAYDDGGHVVQPAVVLLKAAFDADGPHAYQLNPVDGDMALHVAPCEEGDLDPVFVSGAVMLSDVMASHAGYADDETEFWAAIEAAVALAKKKAEL
jgi:hypothetical protein